MQDEYSSLLNSLYSQKDLDFFYSAFGFLESDRHRCRAMGFTINFDRLQQVASLDGFNDPRVIARGCLGYERHAKGLYKKAT